jgi:hypothetical protein
MRLEVHEERRRHNANRLEEATAFQGVHRSVAQRAAARGGANRNQPILAPALRGPRPNPMPSGRSGASGFGVRGFERRGCVVVGDTWALIRQNKRRREIRNAIDIAVEVYRERQRAVDNEAAYWGRRAGFLRNASNNVLDPWLLSSGSGAHASLSSALTSSASSRGRRGEGPPVSFRGDRRRPDMNRC